MFSVWGLYNIDTQTIAIYLFAEVADFTEFGIFLQCNYFSLLFICIAFPKRIISRHVITGGKLEHFNPRDSLIF